MDIPISSAGGSDAAAWAQAWLSAAAILVSSGMAIAAPMIVKAMEKAQDLKDRLRVATDQERSSLIAAIHFKPPSLNVGHLARVTVLDPAGVKLVSGDDVRSSANGDQEGWTFVSEAFPATRTVQVQLKGWEDKTGHVWLRADHAESWGRRATILVEILTNGTPPRRLVEARIELAPPEILIS